MSVFNKVSASNGSGGSTLLYLENKNKKLDKEEIIMYLKSIPELIKETKELLIEIELERNYENE